MSSPDKIGLIEGGVPEGTRLSSDLGPVNVAVPGGLLRGLIGLTRDTEAAMRREAAHLGATHVIETRIRVSTSWFRASAVGHGRAVTLEIAEVSSPE